MTGQVVYFDQCQDDLIGALKWMLEQAEKGELISIVGVGMLDLPEDDNINIATVRAGSWADNMFTTVGGLESMKTRLMVACDESLRRDIERIANEL